MDGELEVPARGRIRVPTNVPAAARSTPWLPRMLRREVASLRKGTNGGKKVYQHISSPIAGVCRADHVRVQLHRHMLLEDAALSVLLVVLSHASLHGVADRCTDGDANIADRDG